MQRARAQFLFHVCLVVGSLALLAAVAYPLWKPLVLAAATASALLPWHDSVSSRLGGRRALAAALLVAGLVLPITLGVGWILSVAVPEAFAGIETVRKVLESSGPEELLERLPAWVPESIRSMLSAIATSGEEVAQLFAQRAPATAAALAAALRTTARIAVDTVFLLIAFYFFLLGGRRLVAWLASVSPVPEETMAVATELARTTRTVLASLFLTAFAQGAVATIGYFVARVPHAVFFGLLTFVAALIPSVGTAIVGLPLALLLLASGHPWAALFLALWALGVVGLIDNVLQPLLIKDGIHISAAAIFFALIGGIATFGPIGLIVGPLALSLFVALATAPARTARAVPAPAEESPAQRGPHSGIDGRFSANPR